MPTNFGTFSLQDLLAAQTPIPLIGEDRAYEAIAEALAAHNRITAETRAQLMDTGTDQLRRYGGAATMEVEDLGEFGTPDAQKVVAGSNVGFPLRRKGASLQWTRDALSEMTGAELAGQVLAMQDADVRGILRAMKAAIYNPVNTDFVDTMVNSIHLPIKALVNADGAPIPPGPNGEAFDPTTHTHYLAVAAAGAPTETEVVRFTEHVIEHYADGKALLYINRADETTVRAFPSFVPYVDARIIPAITAAVGREALNPTQLYNRAIGLLKGVEVWVKPWIVPGYYVTHMDNQSKPLCFRERRAGSGTLQLVADNEQYPLRAQTYRRVYGIAVWNRTNGSVLDTTHTVYTVPTPAQLF